jgi:hypothetical protein
MDQMEHNTAEAVADDALEGVEAIARYLGLASRRTTYLLERGLLPAGKLGTRWVASKKRLSRHYAELADGHGAARAIGTPGG